MSSVKVLVPGGKEQGNVDLPAEIFDVQVNIPLIHQVVVAQLAAARQGTHDTKSRGEVSGGGKKPYKQKGTGQARQGSTRASHWVGGGKAMGPKPRDYSYDVPKQVRRGALKSALSLRAKEQKLFILDSFQLSEVKTKQALAALAKLGIENALIVDAGDNQTLAKSVRNLKNFTFLPPEGLNLFDLLRHQAIILTVPTAKTIEAKLS